MFCYSTHNNSANSSSISSFSHFQFNLNFLFLLFFSLLNTGHNTNRSLPLCGKSTATTKKKQEKTWQTFKLLWNFFSFKLLLLCKQATLKIFTFLFQLLRCFVCALVVQLLCFWSNFQMQQRQLCLFSIWQFEDESVLAAGLYFCVKCTLI